MYGQVQIWLKNLTVDGEYALACLAHIYHTCPSILISNRRMEGITLHWPQTKRRSQYPPSFWRLGPWTTPGSTSPNKAILAARAAMLEGNLLGAFRSSKSYSARLLCRITRCSRMIIAMKCTGPVPDQPKEVGDRVIVRDIGITLKGECKLLWRRRLGALTSPWQLARILIEELQPGL